MFDPQAFMNTTVEEEFKTKRELIPAGEYMCQVENVEARVVGEANRPILSVQMSIINTGDEAIDGRRLYHTIWLDLDEQGNLMSGANKNIGLGQFLAAVGLNGKPWSPGQLIGTVVTTQVKHGINKSNNEMEEKIGRIVKAA